MKVGFVACHERDISLLFRCIVCILRAMIMFWCRYVKCGMLYRLEGFGLNICAYYSWEMALHVGLGVQFDNMYGCKGIRENAKEVNSTKACISNYGISRWIINRRFICINLLMYLNRVRGAKLTTHLQLVPRLRKCGSIHPRPHTPSRRSA
jgi:hypothetical protein